MTVNCAKASSDSSAEILMRKAFSDFARVETEKIFDRSKFLDNANKYPKLDIDEIETGDALGKGSFGIAYECKVALGAGYCDNTKTLTSSLSSFTTDCTDLDSIDDDMSQEDNFDFISSNSRRGEEGIARYAVKMLHEDAVQDPDMFIRGSVDMAVETRILSSIDHPNVIKIYANGKTPYEANYFIVMDRLYDTLKCRINKWGKIQKRNSSYFGSKLFGWKGKNKWSPLEDKLRAALDLSAAVKYLHQRNVVYRDLKSDNVGFDIRDNIKLFDFGLAKEVHTEDRDADGLYKLTAMTGSPMYMAPEVALGKPYGYSCDAYSFAILFWEMYACKTPFESFSMTSIRKRVWGDESARPKIKEDWPDAIKGLLKLAWSREEFIRPPFRDIHDIVEQEYVRVCEVGEKGLELT